MNRTANRKLAFAIGVALGLAIFTPKVHAGDFNGKKYFQPRGPTANAAAASGSSSTLKASLSAAAPTTVSSVLTGGAVSVENTTNAYAYTKSALTTSQGDCPLLGSVDLFIVSGTYEISKCAMWRDVELMTSIQDAEGKQVFSLDSVMNRVCQERSIAEAASECTNRTISRP